MVPGSWTHYLNLNGTGAFLKHDRLQMGFDGTVLMYQTSAQPMFKLDAADFLLQNDAASPVHGILLDGTRPLAWKRYLDLVDGVLAIKDDQATPVLRVVAGKAGAGAQDYGLQVFDKDAATVMDFTGAKRILAVPIQDQGTKSADFTIDLTSGVTQKVQLGASSLRLTFSNPTNGARYGLILQQDTVGSRTMPTFDDIVMWENDTVPTLSTEPGTSDVFEFWYQTNPGRFYGRRAAQNVKLPTPRFVSVTPTTFGTASTTHNVAMPATVDAGDLLLMLFGRSGTSAVTTPTGWTLIGSQGRLFIFAKDAAGTEGGTTVNVATGSAEAGAAQVYRITRWGGTVPTHVEAAFAPQTTNAFPDPPNFDPPGWGPDRNLWIAAFAQGGGAQIANYPSNYVGGIDTRVGTCGVGSARRPWYASAENPGTFELLSSQTWDAATIAVRPPL